MKTFDNRNLKAPIALTPASPYAPKGPPYATQPGISGNQAIVLSGDASGSGTTAITVSVTGIQGHAVPVPGAAGNLRWSGSAWVLDTNTYLVSITGPMVVAALGGKPTITGSKGGNAALASLLTALATMGLLTDSTT